MTREERFEFVKQHILNYVPLPVRNQHVVQQAVSNTAWEIAKKWENEIEGVLDHQLDLVDINPL